MIKATLHGNGLDGADVYLSAAAIKKWQLGDEPRGTDRDKLEVLAGAMQSLLEKALQSAADPAAKMLCLRAIKEIERPLISAIGAVSIEPAAKPKPVKLVTAKRVSK